MADARAWMWGALMLSTLSVARPALGQEWLGSKDQPLGEKVQVPPPSLPIAQATYPFQLKVSDFYGAEGQGRTYYVDSNRLVVVLSNDFGKPSREAFAKTFTPEEKKSVAKLLTSVPVGSLRAWYDDPRVQDGIERSFVFQVDGQPQKKVSVANTEQQDLDRLCAELNKLLPDTLALPKMFHIPKGR